MRSFLSLLVGALVLVVTIAGCDSTSDEDEDNLRRITYTLSANTNDGAIPDGVAATATFWEVGTNQTLVTLEFSGDNTGAALAHPAHIHNNSAEEGGSIAIFLAPIDGTGGGGTSAQVVNRSFDELAAFDGYINIHESNANLGTVVSQGDIGANAEGTLGDGLDLVENPTSVTYDLAAQSNEGAIPDGVAAIARFQELTEDQTLVTLALTDGPTGAAVGHPAHIHNNSASEGGSIAIYLSPIDGTDSPANGATSSKIVNSSISELTAFDGYINIHESNANLGTVVSQGNIGANADESAGAGDSGAGY